MKIIYKSTAPELAQAPAKQNHHKYKYKYINKKEQLETPEKVY